MPAARARRRLPWEGRDARQPRADDPWQTIAPSAIPFGADWAAPRAMTHEDIERVREAFVAAARRAVRIGFDAIELHMAHGYLLHSFVSPISNKRNDEYGGTLEGRMRFPLEVARAVRAVVPQGHAARRAHHRHRLGRRRAHRATTRSCSPRRSRPRASTMSASPRAAITADAQRAPTPGYNVPFAEKVKREVGIATRTVGLIATPKQAEAIVAEGKADMVALARAFLDDPHWGWHAAAALGAEVARPPQYLRAAPKLWPGASYRD